MQVQSIVSEALAAVDYTSSAFPTQSVKKTEVKNEEAVQVHTNNYNFRNMTADEFGGLARSMHERGIISTDEVMTMAIVELRAKRAENGTSFILPGTNVNILDTQEYQLQSIGLGRFDLATYVEKTINLLKNQGDVGGELLPRFERLSQIIQAIGAGENVPQYGKIIS
ncbi:hypothetical protein [Nitrospira sp. M1]